MAKITSRNHTIDDLSISSDCSLARELNELGASRVELRSAAFVLVGVGVGTVIQADMIAAVAIAFARLRNVLFPVISEEHYLISPIRFL